MPNKKKARRQNPDLPSLEEIVLKMVDNAEEKGVLEKDVLAMNPNYEEHIRSLCDSGKILRNIIVPYMNLYDMDIVLPPSSSSSCSSRNISNTTVILHSSNYTNYNPNVDHAFYLLKDDILISIASTLANALHKKNIEEYAFEGLINELWGKIDDNDIQTLGMSLIKLKNRVKLPIIVQIIGKVEYLNTQFRCQLDPCWCGNHRLPTVLNHLSFHDQISLQWFQRRVSNECTSENNSGVNGNYDDDNEHYENGFKHYSERIGKRALKQMRNIGKILKDNEENNGSNNAFIDRNDHFSNNHVGKAYLNDIIEDLVMGDVSKSKSMSMNNNDTFASNLLGDNNINKRLKSKVIADDSKISEELIYIGTFDPPYGEQVTNRPEKKSAGTLTDESSKKKKTKTTLIPRYKTPLSAQTILFLGDIGFDQSEWPKEQDTIKTFTPAQDAVVLEMFVLGAISKAYPSLPDDWNTINNPDNSGNTTSLRSIHDCIFEMDWDLLPLNFDYIMSTHKHILDNLGIKLGASLFRTRVGDLAKSGLNSYRKMIGFIIATRGLSSNRLLGFVLNQISLLKENNNKSFRHKNGDSRIDIVEKHKMQIAGLISRNTDDKEMKEDLNKMGISPKDYDFVTKEMIQRKWIMPKFKSAYHTLTHSYYDTERKDEINFIEFFQDYYEVKGSELSLSKGIASEHRNRSLESAETLVCGSVPSKSDDKPTDRKHGGFVAPQEALGVAYGVANGILGSQLFICPDETKRKGLHKDNNLAHNWTISDVVNPQSWIKDPSQPHSANDDNSAKDLVSVLGPCHKSGFQLQLNSIHTIISKNGNDDKDNLDDNDDEEVEIQSDYIVPWIHHDGTLNEQLYEKLRARVADTLNSMPGIGIDKIQNHLPMLSKEICFEFLELLVEQKVVERKWVRCHTTPRGLFDEFNVLKGSKKKDKDKEKKKKEQMATYFVRSEMKS